MSTTATHAPIQTFDITADLLPGTTLLEASAGTGKTWTIAALVAKHIASGDVRLDEMLVVTFTRAASQELRERVRRQLDEAVQLLTGTCVPDPANRLHTWLLDTDATTREARRDRLTQALVSFDAATIATIHQFCQLVLRSLGVAGDTDASAIAGRGPRAADHRGRRRPLPRPLRVRGAPAVEPRRGAGARAPRHRRPAGRRRAGRRPDRVARLVGGDAGALRVRRAGGAGAPQAPPRRAELRRPAQPARRRPREHRRGSAAPDAAPLEVRADRRVPGHRPGAVAGLPARLLRDHHDGADRRPQAGDLRLPRRRRRDLPPGRRHGDHDPDPRRQLALRPPAARRGPRGPPGRPAR